MHHSKLNKLSVALCLLLLPVSVFAAGLGRLDVNSGIGEPLDANIELLSVSQEELSTIAASVASAQDYSKQNIERPASHGTIKLQVAKNARGEPVLKLKSTQPIIEPYLDMLIQLDWNTGSLLREYTVLLDPPGYKPESANASVANPSTQVKPAGTPSTRSLESANNAAVVTSGASKSGTAKRKSTPVPAVQENAIAADTSTGQEYTTQQGDTLAKIAREMKPADVSLDQMLVGLYETNKEAFSGNNMNRLKVGQILKAPSEEVLQAISAKGAKQEIKVQTRNWNAYRNKLAGIVADSTSVDSEAAGQSSGGKIKSAAEDKSAANSAGAKDVVKLSSAGQAGSDETKSAQAKLTALQEEVDAREKSLQEAQSRTSALEKQIEDMQKLLALKNNEMAKIQSQATQNPAAKPATPENSVSPSAPATTSPAEPTAPAPAVEPPVEENSVKSAQEQNDKTATAPASPAAVDKPSPEVAPAEPPAVKPIVPPVTTPAEEPAGLLDGLIDGEDLPLLAGATALIALLVGGWFYLRQKRKKNLADFEQGIMTSGGLKANTVFGNTSGASIDTGDTSFLTDFSQSANGGMIDTNDVDPIAEAEVYMAYGRDAQAEEILKDAITKEPKRYELHLKLLEMYAASKNMSAFETVSGELYTTLGSDDPTWAKVAEIGIKLEPNNPLYQVNSNPVGAAKTTHTTDKLSASDFSNSPLAAETDLNFSLEQPSEINSDNLGSGNFGSSNKEPDNNSNLDDELLNFNFDNDQPQSLDDISETADAMDAFGQDALGDKKPTANAMNSGVPTLDFDSTSFNHQEDALNYPVSAVETGRPFELTMPDLNFTSPTLQAPLADDISTDEDDIEFAAANSAVSVDTSTISLDLPKLEDVETEASGFASSTPAAAAPTLEPDLNFNDLRMNALEDDMESIELTSDTADADFDAEVKTLDLSDISLELNDHNNFEDTYPVESGSPADTLEIAENEPLEVETKLELVAAYIDMDDKEGAKELLDEVIKEGGKSQRQRAEKLLAQIS